MCDAGNLIFQKFRIYTGYHDTLFLQFEHLVVFDQHVQYFLLIGRKRRVEKIGCDLQTGSPGSIKKATAWASRAVVLV
jgi:hypothetical protein